MLAGITSYAKVDWSFLKAISRNFLSKNLCLIIIGGAAHRPKKDGVLIIM